MNNKFKEFKPTSWSIDNKTSIYVLVFILITFGLLSYNSIPKEQFPEIIIPTIIVSTVYPGSSPSDMENLVTRPLEKNIKSISGVKNITSKSIQDFSSIIVEFNTDVEVSIAKQKVKDAVDKTKSSLPNNLPNDPSVMEIDFSEIPIMYINLSGDYNLDKLKKFAELAQDKIESLQEITRVDIVGALEREIQIDLDMFKMHAASVTFDDVERGVAYENMIISGGTIDQYGMTRSITVIGEFKNIENLRNVILGSSGGALIKLGDIAQVKDGFKKQDSYARLDGKNVITLNVVKKSGQNLLNAADKIKQIIDDLKNKKYPSNLNVSITGDMSKFTRNTLFDLNNTIIIGFILVTIILMFFMGFTNAFFVGLSVPLSMALAYIVMPGIGFTMNMLVMFSFIFALGIVVDDAIVVIENTHRIYRKTGMNIVWSAKYAAGEVFLPILSGTLTTLAPFFPLAFWPGIIGKFMYYIPVTLIITLLASLIVAYIINPIFAVSFMKPEDHGKDTPVRKKRILLISVIMVVLSLIFYLSKSTGMANFTIFFLVSYLFHNFYGYKILNRFQQKIIPSMLNGYEKILRYCLYHKRSYYLMVAMILLLFISLFITAAKKPKVEFFPDNEPNNIIVFIKLPVGTDVLVTDSVTKLVENKLNRIIGKNNPIVESVISNVALGASESMFDSGMKTSNKGKVSVNFIEFNKRRGQSTTEYLDKIRKEMKDIPGVSIAVEKNKMGPPTGKPVNIEISGDKMDELIAVSGHFIRYIDSLEIPGIEELKSDIELNKPEIIIDIDHQRANHEGINTGQVGMAIRTAIYGKEISKYRDGEDQFPIQLRYNEYVRNNIDRVMNLKISYRDMNTGILRQIPLSAVAKVKYQNTYGGVNRKDVKRMVTVSSNVLSEYTANEVIAKIRKAIDTYYYPESIEIKITGEQESQKESMDFLGKAMLLSLFLIIFILITQFNSISKMLIILSEVVFSIIGVLMGYVIFDMTFSIIMTGIGIVALGGIVVRNGILLVEFTDVLKKQGMKTREAIIQGGKTRITPVVLTATATVLGLIPLAIGFNINFQTLFTSLEPNIYFGGENMMFFGNLAWTIVFGLTFATVLTLLFVPMMYFIVYAGKVSIKRRVRRLRKGSK